MKTILPLLAAVSWAAGLTQTAPAQTGNAYADAVLADSPLVYYRFEEASGAGTAQDASSNGRDGTYNNVVLGDASASGTLGAAGRFNNSSSSVTVPALGSLPQLTLEAWVRPNTIVQFDTVYNCDGWAAGYVHWQFASNNRLRFSVNANSPVDLDVGDATVFATGRWHHVAFAYHSAARTLTAYVNGQLVTNRTYTTANAANLTAARIGAWLSGTIQRQFDGLIDEFAIYGSALPAERIQTHYNAAGLPASILFLLSPSNTVAAVSNTVTLTASAQAYGTTAPLSYQWQWNGTNILDATNATYTTPILLAADNGAAFRCLATAGTASATSGVAIVTVIMPQAPRGPLAWLAFENTLDDQGIGPERHDGTLSGGATFTNSVPNATAGASSLLFPGASRVQLANPGDFNLNTGVPFTVSAWIRTAFTSGQRVIVGKSPPAANLISGAAGTHSAALFVDSAGKLRYDLWFITFVASATTVRNGEWMHVAMTYDGGTYRLYVNGLLDGVKAFAGANEGANGEPAWQFTIGQSLNTTFPGADFLGNIDEVAFWNSALPAEEVLGLYTQGLARVGVIFTRHPADTRVIAGQTATFTVTTTVFGTNELPTLQWQKNGVDIEGATNATYTTPALTVADQGARFRCVARLTEVSATSREAVLTVAALETPPPVLAWLSFDYTLTDRGSSANRHDGSFVWDVAFDPLVVNETAGTASAYFVFGDEWSRVDLEHDGDFNLNSGAAFTLAAWIRTEFTNGQRVIAAKSPPAANLVPGATGTHTAALFVDNAGKLRYDLWNVAGVSSATTVRNGEWMHVAVTFENGTYRLFVNGFQDASSTFAGANEGANGEPPWEFTLGQSLNNLFPGGGFQGNIDELAFWNRALTQGQILSVFARGLGAIPPLLRHERAGGQLTLSWDSSGYSLQQNADLDNPGGWTSTPNGNTSPVQVNLSGQRLFFRLRKP